MLRDTARATATGAMKAATNALRLGLALAGFTRTHAGAAGAGNAVQFLVAHVVAH
jgi:hypothetical protein